MPVLLREESKRRGHKRNESISGDALKNLDKEVALLGEGKESESESDTDPYESEYARQFRSPKERKSKRRSRRQPKWIIVANWKSVHLHHPSW